MNASGQITKAYGWQPQGLWSTDPLWQATLSPGQTLANAQYTFTATDHLGTPQIATDANGQKVWKGISEAFGKTTPEPGSAITQNLRFPGQYYDPETQMHQNYFRDYRPELGRYLESDPIGLRGGVNLWGYVSANALKAVDYSGMIKWEGSVVSLTAGPFPFAGVDHYKLKSECKCGKRISLILSSYYVGFPVAATWNAPACFEDKSPCPNAQSLSGLYQKPFVSLTWGIWGGSLSRPTSGDGISCWGWSNQRGLDISAGIAVGYSNPRVISEEDCCDD